MMDGWSSTYAAMHRDGEAAFPPAAMRYVLELTRGEARKAGGSLAPSEMIAAFRRSARADFGALTPEVLEHWDLRTPESLGHAVRTLARYGCLNLDDGDSPKIFAADSRSLAEAES